MRRRFLFFIAPVLILLDCSHDTFVDDSSQDDSKENRTEQITLTKTQRNIVKANNSFAFNLFRETCKSALGESFFFSPFSLEYMLSLILNGAGGETYSQIVTALGYENYTLEEINGLYSSMESILAQSGNDACFLNAKALWLNDMDPDAGFCDNIRPYYGSVFHKAVFSSPDTPALINAWCSENTGGMIDSIIGNLSPNSLIIFLNALFFEGTWNQKFDRSLTTEDEFYGIDGGCTGSKSFMRMSAFVPSAMSDGNKACLLSFGRGQYQLMIVLPAVEKDYYEFVSSFDAKKYQEYYDALRMHTVNLRVPRMSVTCDLSDELSGSMRTLGIRDAFDDTKADFSQILDTKGSLGLIKQKARFEMDEDGARVAAATIAEDAALDSFEEFETMEFNANHPFLFVINEYRTGAILLMGSFVK